jgi:hypothetical protein
VACINQMYKVCKETNKCIWIYECNLITWQSLKCFFPLCGHLRGYENKNTNSTHCKCIFILTSLNMANITGQTYVGNTRHSDFVKDRKFLLSPPSSFPALGRCPQIKDRTSRLKNYESVTDREQD